MEKTRRPYPDWHLRPLKLTSEEMANPYLVLEQFFDAYHLTDARKCLKEILYDSLRAMEPDALSHVALCDDLERLIEGAWLLFDKRPGKKRRKDKHSGKGGKRKAKT